MKKLILLAFMLIANVFAGEWQEEVCGDKSLSYCINHFDRQCKAKNYFACWTVGGLYREQEQYSKAKKYLEMVCDEANSGDSFQMELIDGSMGPEVPIITTMQLSCGMLGDFYYNGKGVRQNLSKAEEFYGRACDLGYQEGCDFYKGHKEEINNIAKCLGGSVEACDDIAGIVIGKLDIKDVKQYRLKDAELNCKDYMKVIRKGCNLGSGRCCALLGNEFHSISVWKDAYNGWQPKYGANCSLRNQNEAFKYYKKACDLGESEGCALYTQLQNYIDEINMRERDKTYKGDITVRQK